MNPLREWVLAELQWQHLSQRDLARRMGVNIGHLGDILRGAHRLSAQNALRLEMVLGRQGGKTAAELMVMDCERQLAEARERMQGNKNVQG